MIPDNFILFLAGTPASGKSTFARYLAQTHGFTHYDLEHYPEGWPDPTLNTTLERSRIDFIKQLRIRHPRVVLDWGFPLSYLSWVREFQSENVLVIWITGHSSRAREIFVARNKPDDVIDFDRQLRAITAASLPESMNCSIVDALSADGTFIDACAIENLIFRQTTESA